jgi:hypothetical protein
MRQQTGQQHHNNYITTTNKSTPRGHHHRSEGKSDKNFTIPPRSPSSGVPHGAPIITNEARPDNNNNNMSATTQDNKSYASTDWTTKSQQLNNNNKTSRPRVVPHYIPTTQPRQQASLHSSTQQTKLSSIAAILSTTPSSMTTPLPLKQAVIKVRWCWSLFFSGVRRGCFTPVT